jgi:hypothetical protein
VSPIDLDEKSKLTGAGAYCLAKAPRCQVNVMSEGLRRVCRVCGIRPCLGGGSAFPELGEAAPRTGQFLPAPWCGVASARRGIALLPPSVEQQPVPLDYAVTKVAMASLVVRAVALGLPIDRLVVELVMHQRRLRRWTLGYKVVLAKVNPLFCDPTCLMRPLWALRRSSRAPGPRSLPGCGCGPGSCAGSTSCGP